MKSHKETQCELLCKQIARLRAGGRCEISGRPGPEVHHVFFGRAVPWQLKYNHNFYICLAGDQHRTRDDAPHIDNDKFIELITNRLADRPHVQLILRQLELPRPEIIKPDWYVLHKALKAEHDRFEATCWMDSDIKPEYGRICA